MDSTIEELKHLECPMNWGDLTVIRQSAKIDRIVERVQEKLEENNTEHPWKAMINFLFLSYEKFMSQKSTYDMSYLRHCQEVIMNDFWLRRHFTAAQHLLYAIWANTYIKLANYKSALNYISKVKNFKEMSNEDQAFLLSMKACFYMMYGPPGNAEASKIFTKVLELEENVAEWYYLRGKCFARIRRLHYRSKPTREEISSFKKATELEEDCARYMIHLARSEADMVSVLRHTKTSIEDFKVIEALEADVESILRKAARLSVESTHLMCHMAKSFMKLPYYFRMRNFEFTQFCVTKAIEISPLDPMVNHTLGLFYLTQNDVENAFNFLTTASKMGVHAASIDLCRLKWKECRGYDPIPDLTEIIEQNDQFAGSEAHCLIATYYFFVKNDLLSTVEHWKQWLRCREKESFHISSHFLGQESFDFTSVLYDEIRLELGATRYKNSEDRVKLEEVLTMVRENRPELEGIKPRRQRQNLIDRAQMVSRLGRSYPDSIHFLRRERWVTKGRPFEEFSSSKQKKMTEKITMRKGKKLCVSSKNNFKTFRKREKGADKKPQEDRRSQSASRIHDYRKKKQKPFWLPPRRQGSVGNLKKESLKESVDGLEKVSLEKFVLKEERSSRLGSGRISPNLARPGELNFKAVSAETLVLLKSYEQKSRPYKKGASSSSADWRSRSQESLNASSTDKYYGRRPSRDMGSRTLSSERVFRTPEKSSEEENLQLTCRTYSSEQLAGVHSTKHPSVDFNDRNLPRAEEFGSGVEPRRSWRRDQNTGEQQAAPKSSFFQAWKKSDASDSLRSSPRALSVGQEDVRTSPFFQSQNNRGQGDSSRPSSRPSSSSVGQEDAPTSAFFQSWNNRRQGDSSRPSSRSSSVGQEDAPPSAFFQSWNNRRQGDSSRPSSRSSSVGQEDAPPSAFFQSWNNRRQGESSTPSSRSSSVGQEGAPNSAFFHSRNNRDQGGSLRPESRASSVGQGEDQTRSAGRGSNYMPRGGSFSRGGQRTLRGRRFDARESTELRGNLHDSFKQLNIRKD